MYQSLLLAITDTPGPNNNNKILLEMFVVAAVLEGIFVFVLFFSIKSGYLLIKVHLPNLINV